MNHNFRAYLFHEVISLLGHMAFLPFGILLFYRILNNSIEQTALLYMLLFTFQVVGILCIPLLSKVFKIKYLYYAGIVLMTFSTLLLTKPITQHILIAWVLFNGVGRSLYFLPKIFFIGETTNESMMGAQTAKLTNVVNITKAVGPAIGGYIAWKYGMVGLALFSSVCYASSMIFLRKLPNTKLDFSELQQTYRLKRTSKEAMLSSLDSFFVVMSAFLWPLVTYLILDGAPLNEIGYLLAASVLVRIVVTNKIGSIVDHMKNKIQLIHIGSVIYAFGWILRALIINPATYLLFNSMFQVINSGYSTAVSTIDYTLVSKKISSSHFHSMIVIREFYRNMMALVPFALAVLLFPNFGPKSIVILSAIVGLLFYRL